MNNHIGKPVSEVNEGKTQRTKWDERIKWQALKNSRKGRLTSRLGYKTSFAGRRIFHWKGKKREGGRQKPERRAKEKK